MTGTYQNKAGGWALHEPRRAPPAYRNWCLRYSHPVFPSPAIPVGEFMREAQDYARGQPGKSYYASRSQTDPVKREHDCFTGKLGEFVVHKYLSVPRPDIELRSRSKKSWASDFPGGLACKTQDYISYLRYGLSWTFQVEDPILKYPQGKCCALVLLKASEGRGRVLNVLRMEDVVGMLRNPRLPRLVGVKRVLYWDDCRSLDTAWD